MAKKQSKSKAATPVAAKAPKAPAKRNPPKKPAPGEKVDLFRSAVCVDLSFQKPGNTRKIRNNEYEIKVGVGKQKSSIDQKAVKVQKELLDSREFDAIVQFDAQASQFVKSMGLDSPLKRGTYLVPIALLKRVTDHLDELINDREILVEKFLATYPERVNDAKIRLKDAFESKNYPSTQEMRNEFSMTYKIFSFFVPDSIKSLEGDIYEKEAIKLQDNMRNLYTEISNSLRLGLKNSVGRLVNALTPHEDGKRKKIYDSNVESLLDFLETFSAKNIVGDEDCAILVSQAKALIGGGTADSIAESLRCDEMFRSDLAKKFGQISDQLEGMVTLDDSREVDLS